MTDLFLVDAPLHRSRGIALGKQASTRLQLPLADNRGGLVVPCLHGNHSHSLQESLQRFSSHYWHLDVLFASGKTCLSPTTFFHLLASPIWEDNLRLLDDNIKRIAFNDIRRPSRLINDQLHDLREALVSLQEQATMTIKWMPSSVQDELESIRQRIASAAQSSNSQAHTYVGYPRESLQDILERCTVLEHFLMDSFHLLVSSTSVLNAETEMEQANRSQRLTQLAFLYVSLSFVTGIFGMNVKEINGSRLSGWVAVVALAVTAGCTAAVFVTAKQWETLFARAKGRESDIQSSQG